MTSHDERSDDDPQLRRLLQSWPPPVIPDGMDERILAARRRTAPGGWRRFFTASIRVPVPVAVALALVFVLTAFLALRASRPAPSMASPQSSGPVQAARAAAPPLVTRTSLAGFQPESELRASVVTETAQ
jgi:hypothetical protein